MRRLTISTDFPGGSLGPVRIDGTSVSAILREEPVTHADFIAYDYRLHFCFLVKNVGSAAIEVEVKISDAGADERPLSYRSRIYSASDLKDLALGDRIEAAFDGHKSYRFNLRLQPGEARFLANGPVRPYEEVSATFEQLAASTVGERIVYGRSLEGRDLVAYRFERPDGYDRPEVLIVSGSHPPEGDTFASEAILRALPTHEETWLSRFNLTIVPIVNPDGFVHGLAGSNLSGRNVYWAFDPNDVQEMPETHYLWQLFGRVRPNVYLDFHAYTFQGARKRAGPYIKPLLFYSGITRRVASRMNERVVRLCGGHQARGWSTDPPSTPGARLTAAYNTITYAKFHFHMDHELEGVRQMAVSLPDCVAETLLEFAQVTASQLRGVCEGSEAIPALRHLACQSAWGLRMRLLRPLRQTLRRATFG